MINLMKCNKKLSNFIKEIKIQKMYYFLLKSNYNKRIYKEKKIRKD